jgi:hypothetical protein
LEIVVADEAPMSGEMRGAGRTAAGSRRLPGALEAIIDPSRRSGDGRPAGASVSVSRRPGHQSLETVDDEYVFWGRHLVDPVRQHSDSAGSRFGICSISSTLQDSRTALTA